MWSRRRILGSGAAAALVGVLPIPAFAEGFAASDWGKLGKLVSDLANGLDRATATYSQKTDPTSLGYARSRLKQIFAKLRNTQAENADTVSNVDAYANLWQRWTNHGKQALSPDQTPLLQLAWDSVAFNTRELLGEMKAAMLEMGADENDPAFAPTIAALDQAMMRNDLKNDEVAAALAAKDKTLANQIGYMVKLTAGPAPVTLAGIAPMADAAPGFARARKSISDAIDALNASIPPEHP